MHVARDLSINSFLQKCNVLQQQSESGPKKCERKLKCNTHIFWQHVLIYIMIYDDGSRVRKRLKEGFFFSLKFSII